MRPPNRIDEGTARRLKREIQAIARQSRKPTVPAAAPMPRIWIIYAHTDEAVAGGLVERLRADSIAASWDKDLLPGVDYDMRIEQNIRECDSAVVIWSEAARRSRYVLDEATLAYELERLVPVHVAGFDPTTLSMRFRRLQATSVTEYEKLLTTLKGLA